MLRVLGGFVAGIFGLLLLTGSAFAAPIVGEASPTGASANTYLSSAYNSSIAAGGIQPHVFTGTNGTQLLGLGGPIHQFALVVQVAPDPPETPEPSTMTLFGTGLIVVAGAVRRKVRVNLK